MTITRYRPGQPANKPASVQRPDGTVEVYTYDGRNALIAAASGQPDFTGTNVVNGTVRRIAREARDAKTTEETRVLKAGQEGLRIGWQETTKDAFGRPLVTKHLNGTETTRNYDCCGVGTETDAEGSATVHSYDALKRPQSVLRGGIVSSYRHDAAGRRLASYRQGTNGTVVQIDSAAYDLSGRLTAQTNALGAVTRMEYLTDAEGQSVTVTTQPDGGTRVETYFQDGSLRSVTGTAVSPVRYEYGVDLFGGAQRSYTLEIKLDAEGKDTVEWTKSFTDGQGRTIAVVYPDGAQQTSEYNAQGQLVRSTDPDGVVTLRGYNMLGEQEYSAVDVNHNGQIDLAGPDRVSRTVRDYSEREGLTVERVRTYAWPELGQAEPVLASTHETALNAQRAHLSWATQHGLTTESRTEFLGGGARVSTTTAPDGSRNVSIHQEGRLRSVTRKNAQGESLGGTTYEYDAHGRRSASIDARNGRTSYEYNSGDQTVRVTTPTPAEGQPAQVTQTEYDAMGRASRVIYPDGASLTNEYYLTGALKAKHGARTYPVAYTYDAQGRMKTMTTWSDFAKREGARTTTWDYDAKRGWLSGKLYPDQKGPSYEYWPSGKIKTRRWARGIDTRYAYDAAGQLSGIDYTDTNTAQVAYEYDRLGRQTKIAQGKAVTTRAYNLAGQMLGESYTGGVLDGLAVSNRYDAYLRRTNLAALATGASTEIRGGKDSAKASVISDVNYTYDEASRLKRVIDGEYSAEYHYLANSPLVEQIDFRNGEVTRMTTVKKYDRLNRLELIESQPSADSPISYAYGYNQANQRTNAVLGDGTAWVYEYDDLGQVTVGKKVDRKGNTLDGYDFRYAYDDIGNRKRSVSNGAETDYQADALNRYTSSTKREGAKAEEPAAYQYDEDGNLKSDATWLYTWDAENRLIAMESGASVARSDQKRLEFAYDTQSRRIAKTVYDKGADAKGADSKAGRPTTSLTFIYDGWNLIAELNELATPHSPLATYVWGLDLSGTIHGAGGVGGLLICKPFRGQRAENAWLPVYDGNGSIVAWTPAEGEAMLLRGDDSPFGSATNQLSEAGFSLGYSTKYSDTESGLAYYGYRYLATGLGAWISADPAAEGAGVNLHSFVDNNPVSRYDLLGLLTSGSVVDVMDHGERIGEIKVHVYSLREWEYGMGVEAQLMLIPSVNKTKTCAAYKWRQHFTHKNDSDYNIIEGVGEVGSKWRYYPKNESRVMYNILDVDYTNFERSLAGSEWYSDLPQALNEYQPPATFAHFSYTFNDSPLILVKPRVTRQEVRFITEFVGVKGSWVKKGGEVKKTFKWGFWFTKNSQLRVDASGLFDLTAE